MTLFIYRFVEKRGRVVLEQFSSEADAGSR
jgi:hypothetical protein